MYYQFITIFIYNYQNIQETFSCLSFVIYSSLIKTIIYDLIVFTVILKKIFKKLILYSADFALNHCFAQIVYRFSYIQNYSLFLNLLGDLYYPNLYLWIGEIDPGRIWFGSSRPAIMSAMYWFNNVEHFPHQN